MQRAYARGDVEALMTLFAQNPTAQTRAALQSEYKTLFDSTRARSLHLRDIVWLVDDDTAIGLGRYDASVTRRQSDRARRSSGGVRVELRLEGGEARIVRLSHDGGRAP